MANLRTRRRRCTALLIDTLQTQYHQRAASPMGHDPLSLHELRRPMELPDGNTEDIRMHQLLQASAKRHVHMHASSIRVHESHRVHLDQRLLPPELP
eukprot:905-Eustigmatos_ZCMA.PRE.1